MLSTLRTHEGEVQEREKMKHSRSPPMPLDKIDAEKSIDTAWTESRGLLASEKFQPEEGPAPEDGWRDSLRKHGQAVGNPGFSQQLGVRQADWKQPECGQFLDKKFRTQVEG